MRDALTKALSARHLISHQQALRPVEATPLLRDHVSGRCSTLAPRRRDVQCGLDEGDRVEAAIYSTQATDRSREGYPGAWRGPDQARMQLSFQLKAATTPVLFNRRSLGLHSPGTVSSPRYSLRSRIRIREVPARHVRPRGPLVNRAAGTSSNGAGRGSRQR
jgi:hypothetical protein